MERPTPRGGTFHAWLYYCGLTPLFKRSWRQAAEVARRALPNGGNIVDIECGTGGLTKTFLRYQFQCVGVEWNAWMLHEAGRHLHATRHKTAPVELLLADGDRLPLPDASFHLSMNFLGLHNKSPEEQGGLLAEMRRLAPLTILLDWQLPERNLHIPAAMLMRKLTSNGRAKANSRAYYKAGALEGVLHRYSDRMRVRERLSCLGGSLGVALIEWR